MTNTKNINIAELAGLIYNQPTGKATPNSFVAKFMLQVANKSGKGYKLVPITLWGDNATKVLDGYQKGSEIHLKGEIEVGSYLKDGEKKYTWGVVATEILTEEVPF